MTGAEVVMDRGGGKPPAMSAMTISLTDTPVGYASLGKSYATSATNATTVKTRTQLIEAVARGGVIIIDGMIDMSDGKLVAARSKSTESTDKLDVFVKSQLGGKYQTYKAWVEAYSKACKQATDDDKESTSTNSTLYADVQALNKAYGSLIRLDLQSGTTLIGKGSDCGIRGGTIQINGKSNIQVRNLTIQDPFDPFPHHEANDGYNAQWDGINIQGTSKNIWIDHCMFEDTIELGYVQTSGNSDSKYKEKWQTYDGLCDMKGNSEYITVSNCVFKDHDKTMLIGSSDTETVSVTRTVTLYRNHFYNCGQRLPMVRITNVHVVNNYYDASSPHYTQQYAIGVRYNANVYSENNYFSSGIQYSVSGNTDKKGTLYSTGDMDNSKSGRKSGQFNTTSTVPFSPSYIIEKIAASDVPNAVKNNAGADYTLNL